ncbi:MAG: membrane protein insertase YidC [Pirellulales bacterium]
MTILVGNYYLTNWLKPPAQNVAKVAAKDKAADKAGQAKGNEQPKLDAAGPDKDAGKAPADAAAPQPPADAAAPAAEPEFPARWLSLGSADPTSPYRMLVTFNTRGAAIERVELSDPRYRAEDNRSGYLGHVAVNNDRAGCLVQVVGPGTPAAVAGLQAGDRIESLDGRPIADAVALSSALADTKPRDVVELQIRRGEEQKKLSVTLGRHPLSVIRPEAYGRQLDVVDSSVHDPFSFLLTLAQVDAERAPDDKAEMPGLDLHTRAWEVVSSTPDSVEFRLPVNRYGLELIKRFKLAQVPAAELSNRDYPGYHLTLEVEMRNTGAAPRSVAYRLNGPNGLPTEGWWFAHKISRNSWTAGLRDVVVHFENAPVTMATRQQIADSDPPVTWLNSPLDFVAVDAQYFASALLPQKKDPADIWFSEVRPLLLSKPAEKTEAMLANTSVRMTSHPASLAPGAKQTHAFQVFVGPKRTDLLSQYNNSTQTDLSDLVYYGWFGWVARPLTRLLHGFYFVVGNYGIAIVMLTVVVRSCMFPLSRKQALAAQKMQELQPEIKRITERYKDDLEARSKAQQELFRKHNYNPLGGCLLMFVQLPIFMGLYRALMVDVELWQAPLLSDAIRWCSNLAAPDMLFYWGNWMPGVLAAPLGWLGPYFNLLPIFTVGLFLWQTHMFMPPPTDEQTAMQQKIMKYMTVFMGVMFFKVASGLCVYFTASSLWGIAERKLLPKTLPPKPGDEPGAERLVKATPSGGNGSPAPQRPRPKPRGKR